ncbi:hypothetical protein SAMN05880582_101248 [Rhizobium sp. RU20A]|uniref:hypothetical protein n=1 Tax=Rhizobium sp. RU20A TaxID=1907412 RepID=UPI0009544964|nr:hypothetical protein [Rhizobium sp. RU20A]SIP97882.1 hypothetical protein SAMN05880582_101248 [Rhizobium sp. RU20A]
MVTAIGMVREQLTDRPLLVCDVDEVVLEFLGPFRRFLAANGLKLLPRSFRLHGNIVAIDTGTPIADEAVHPLIEMFFAEQCDWQTPACDVATTLAMLSEKADVVFLTAMPPRHHDLRRTLLNGLDLTFPMIATEEPKGPVVADLHRGRDLPLAFIDDIARNLASVGESVPQCLLVHLMADREFRALMPVPDAPVICADDWAGAHRLVSKHFWAGEPA